MIYLYSDKKKVNLFNSFEDLLEYFNRIENSPIDNYNSYQAQQRWNFIYRPYRKPSNDLRAGDGMEIEEYVEEQALIEIFVGDPQNPYKIPVTPALDLIELMRDWCFDYGSAHGYCILELLNGINDLQKPQFQHEGDFSCELFKNANT
jgi:hypothetical protein